MVKINIGGVPEHFNMPWHWAIETGLFKRAGLDVVWKTYSGGTGAMNVALRASEIDVAILLTEGAIADIIHGNPSSIVSWYVKSPLDWGIYVSSTSEITDISHIKGKKYAVSRIGSGSHLMACVDCANRGYELHPDQFVIVNNLDGAIQSLSSGESEVFMWERFTTKPLVDNGIFRMLDICPTPWPCFVVVVRNAFLAEHIEAVRTMMEIIHNEASKFKNLPSAVDLIASKYKQMPTDVHEWLKTVTWADGNAIDSDELENVQNILFRLNLVNKKVKTTQIIYDLR